LIAFQTIILKSHHMRKNQIYSILWGIIFAVAGATFQSNGWPIVSWLFFILSGMSVLTFFKS